MANTSSIKFPNMFNVSQNSIAVLEDAQSIVNRTKLLILTDPTEEYNEPDFGVGIKRHLFKYNTDNERAMFLDRFIDQLGKHEPYADAQETKHVNGLMFTGTSEDSASFDKMEMTLGVATTFGDVVSVDIDGTSVTI